MQRYDEEIVVVKYGGHAMGAEHLAREFARDIVLLEQTAINPVVVHGGGPQIEAMLKQVGVQSQYAAGLRITDAKTLEIVEMVLAGSINKQMVGHINAAGGKAIGLCHVRVLCLFTSFSYILLVSRFDQSGWSSASSDY